MFRSIVVSEADVVDCNKQVRIVHKDADIVAGFCVNAVNGNCVAVASGKDVHELDLTNMLASQNSWVWVEESTDDPTNNENGDFAMLADAPQPRLADNLSSWADMGVAQTGQGAAILTKRPLGGVKSMQAHPTLPYYLTGCRDGGICIWEWGHQHQIGQYRPMGGGWGKVCSVRFSQHGNKFAAVDGDGYVSLWQVGVYERSHFHHLVHNRVANDCAFVASCSVVATCGMSSNHKNIAIWDSLLPKRSCLVKGQFRLLGFNHYRFLTEVKRTLQN